MIAAPMAAPAGAMSQAPDDDAGQLAEIVIAVMKDGTFSVYVEDEGAEDQGQEPAGGAEPPESETAEQGPNAKTANSIGEALKIVLDLYKQVQSGSGMQSAQDQFSQGYSRASQGQPGGRMS